VDLVSPAAALLLAVLLSAGQKVVYVPGRVVHGMAQVFRGEGKTNAKDTLAIADTARIRGDLAELAATDDLTVELTRLTSYRALCLGDPADYGRGAGSFIEGGAVLGEIAVAFGDLGRCLGLARGAVLVA
jgi:hypothetical protein